MRLSKTITIDDMRITVYEVSVADLLAFLQDDTGEVQARLELYLPRCTDLGFEKLKAMYPSELKAIWDAFREVNAVFFSTIDQMGLAAAIIDEVKAAVIEEMEKERAKERADRSTGGPSSPGSLN